MNRPGLLLLSRSILFSAILLLTACGGPADQALSRARRSAGDSKLDLGLTLKVSAQKGEGDQGEWTVEVEGDTSQSLGMVRFQLHLPRGWSTGEDGREWEQVLSMGTTFRRSILIQANGEPGGVMALQAWSEEQGTTREVYLEVGEEQTPPVDEPGRDSMGRPVRFTEVPHER